MRIKALIGVLVIAINFLALWGLKLILPSSAIDANAHTFIMMGMNVVLLFLIARVLKRSKT